MKEKGLYTEDTKKQVLGEQYAEDEEAMKLLEEVEE